MVQWHRAACWARLLVVVTWGWATLAPGVCAAGSDVPAVVRGSYRLVVQSQQERVEDDPTPRIWQEVETAWSSDTLLVSGLLEMPLASHAFSRAEPARWEGRLDWRLLLLGAQDRAGWQGQWTAGYFWSRRPLPTGDAFRLFHPDSDLSWGHALTTQLHLFPRAEGRASQAGSRWWAAYQRAWGASAGRGITWWQLRWEGAEHWRWRFTAVAGEGKILEDGRMRGPDPYRGWSLDGSRHWDWGQLEWGYARRSDPLEEGYRAAGFIRLKTRRRGTGSVAATAELFRRDDGFRFPLGGDLPWRANRQGGLLGLEGRWGRWEGRWERLWEQPVTHPQQPMATTDFIRLTWRPGGSWWARLEQELEAEDEGIDQLLYVRWPASAFGVQARRTLGADGERWRFRAEWEPRSQRVRLDWDSRLETWRAEYRREWERFRIRMVYKERLDPGRPGRRETFRFLQATYSPGQRWQMTVTLGWDDRGRADFHWGRGQRWELAWEILF